MKRQSKPRRSRTENSEKNSAGTKKPRGNPEKTKPYRFPPGKSGNPGGRPKKTKLTDASREWLEQINRKTGKTNAQLVAAALGKRALKGDTSAYNALADRTEGKATHRVEVTGKDGQPERVEITGKDGEAVKLDLMDTIQKVKDFYGLRGDAETKKSS
jgi:Family of unknown function (DUF5681)